MIAPDRCGGKSLCTPTGRLREPVHFAGFCFAKHEVRHFRQ
jgi:hypothetical protein